MEVLSLGVQPVLVFAARHEEVTGTGRRKPVREGGHLIGRQTTRLDRGAKFHDRRQPQQGIRRRKLVG